MDTKVKMPVTLKPDPHEGKCCSLVADWRAKKTGDALCQNPVFKNGYCRRHQHTVEKKTRGQQSVLAEYKKIGTPRKISPIAAMTTLLHEAAGNVEYLRNEVSKLERLVIAGRKEREEVAKMVVLYNEERDRLERYTLDAIRVRLDERQIQLYESQAQAMVTVVKSIIDGIGLMGENRIKALGIAATQMNLYASKKDKEWDGPFMEAEKLSAIKVVDATVLNVSQDGEVSPEILESLEDSGEERGEDSGEASLLQAEA